MQFNQTEAQIIFKLFCNKKFKKALLQKCSKIRKIEQRCQREINFSYRLAHISRKQSVFFLFDFNIYISQVCEASRKNYRLCGVIHIGLFIKNIALSGKF